MVNINNLVVTATALLAPVLAAPAPAAAGSQTPSTSSGFVKRSGDVIEDSYIVALKPNTKNVDAHVQWVQSIQKRNLAKRGLRARVDEGVGKTYKGSNTFKGYSGVFDEDTIEDIRKSSEVAFVEPNRVWTIEDDEGHYSDSDDESEAESENESDESDYESEQDDSDVESEADEAESDAESDLEDVEEDTEDAIEDAEEAKEEAAKNAENNTDNKAVDNAADPANNPSVEAPVDAGQVLDQAPAPAPDPSLISLPEIPIPAPAPAPIAAPVRKRRSKRSRHSKRAPAVQQDVVNFGLAAISHRQPGAVDYLYDDIIGEGTFAYVVDSGILTTHEDFEGDRAEMVWSSFEGDMSDSLGHGTHVASILGGNNYGVAKNTKILGVKVFEGRNTDTSVMIDGIKWAIDDLIANDRTDTAVINLSVSGPQSDIINSMIDEATSQGVIIVGAAGNHDMNANEDSPASAAGTITVGAVDKNFKMWRKSNWGDKLDVFAPGAGVTAAGIESDTDTKTDSGTSMAAAHVSGLVLSALSVDGVKGGREKVLAHLQKNATPEVVKGFLSGSLNLLVNNGNSQQE